VDLVVERVAWAAATGAGRVAALDHEAADHPVEDDAVVVRAAARLAVARVRVRLRAFGEFDEIADSLRRVVGEQFHADGSDVGVQRRERLLSHQ
jgi:hypothetical protein